MTVDEMLTEARYQFYQSGGGLRAVTDQNDRDCDDIRELRETLQRRGEQLGRATGTEPSSMGGTISTWCEWINSYRDALNDEERHRRLESWRRAERVECACA